MSFQKFVTLSVGTFQSLTYILMTFSIAHHSMLIYSFFSEYLSKGVTSLIQIECNIEVTRRSKIVVSGMPSCR